MTTFIVLNADQADTVRGPGDLPDTALAPRAILNGVFILPLAVLTDPAHADDRPFLLTLPQREVLPQEFPAEAGE